MKTINLRDYRSHPNAPLYIFLGVLVLLFLVNALAPQQAHVDTVRPTPALQPILVIATPVPTIPPTPDTQVQAEIAALKARVAELEAAQRAPVVEPQEQIIYVQAAPTVAPPTPQPVPQLQAVTVPDGEEPLSDAQMREAQDQ